MKNKNKKSIIHSFVKDINEKLTAAVYICLYSILFVFIGNFLKCFNTLAIDYKIDILPLANCFITFGILGIVFPIIICIGYYILKWLKENG